MTKMNTSTSTLIMSEKLSQKLPVSRLTVLRRRFIALMAYLRFPASSSCPLAARSVPTR